MTVLSFFNNRKIWQTKNFEPPWEHGRESIFDFVEKIENDDEVELPDEEPRENNEISFAAGALDGIFTHHSFGNSEDGDAEIESNKLRTRIIDNLKLVLQHPSPENLSKFYSDISSESALSVVDDLIDRVSKGHGLDIDKLEILLLWIVKNSPDRDAVKIAVALLGMYQTDQYRDVFLTLGKHSEFTLFASVALSNSNSGDAKDIDLWHLAKQVQGWGRIQTVERLAQTTNPDIKAWLVREGYKNAIMYEYLAWFCAVNGDLLTELKHNKDEALLFGAADILRALIFGGPAEDISDYDVADAVCVLFLERVAACENVNNRLLLAAASLRSFLDDKEDTRSDAWSDESKADVMRLANQILDTEIRKQNVIRDLSNLESENFWETRELGELLDIDVWPYLFARQEKGLGDEWFFLMRTKKASQIDQVLALAEAMLPLDKIATGPALHNGFGPDYEIFSGLDFILQDLDKWPGRGWLLLQAGLRSPVIRHRNLSIKALEAWGQSNWPEQVIPILERAVREELDEELKLRFEKLLNGEPTEKEE